jgi:FtsZ-interacting cell division protein ZipA
MNLITTIIISFIIIILIHYLWNYIKDKFSYKRTKNLVDYQTKKYKEIINNMASQKEETTYINETEKKVMMDDLINLL